MTDPIATDAIATRKVSATPRHLRRYLALDDFERRARRFLPKAIYGYVAGGVETDQSLTMNRSSFTDLSFVPKVLRNVAGRDLSHPLLGVTQSLPFGIAPMGFSALVAPDGDVALARAAQEAGTLAICSAASLTPLERVAQAGKSRWFQAYLPGDERRVLALLDRLQAAGFETLVVTADVPVAANRENNARNGFDAPFRMSPDLVWQGITHPGWTMGTLLRGMRRTGMPHFENMEAVQGPPLFSRTLVRSTIARDRLSWDEVALIRRNWPGKVVLKGILAPDDARRAADEGMDGIIVSNHGGRQLDGAIAPLHALPAIRVVSGDMSVMLDGGIRRGTDILKALALGADFVFVGRPFLFAAAVAGVDGVRHALTLMRDEIDRDMALLGITRLSDLSPDLLRTRA
ncbi:alpha-hydroxy acid oxidase [Falsirhodobacter halotolerans]|uniref:alpha-hydroxy acid oxidase n=1 Tax=Falsirhodobacter halotolerans TaxID=1146892 RepID=UPI001FD59CC7|nr:alpha-hydroxy acid oxidase [Falsirhodobacter halotolerans]MCJ8139872.1 alpha-hydroxy-acid oxidizing protein [Falsirhodobacter halotolerans]